MSARSTSLVGASGRSPGSWIQGSVEDPSAASTFPDLVQRPSGITEAALHSRWRDRAGFAPASLLCPSGHPRSWIVRPGLGSPVSSPASRRSRRQPSIPRLPSSVSGARLGRPCARVLRACSLPAPASSCPFSLPISRRAPQPDRPLFSRGAPRLTAPSLPGRPTCGVFPALRIPSPYAQSLRIHTPGLYAFSRSFRARLEFSGQAALMTLPCCATAAHPWRDAPRHRDFSSTNRAPVAHSDCRKRERRAPPSPERIAALLPALWRSSKPLQTTAAHWLDVPPCPASARSFFIQASIPVISR